MTSLVQAPWLNWPQTRKLVSLLGAEQMRFVGGAVRDSLLGLPVTDVDIATVLMPGEVTACLEPAGIKVVPTGIDHGTVTAVVDGKPFEVTTLRRDVTTDGRRATVAFTADWQEDAARRDFTINALYLSNSGEVFDYFGGIDDLRNHLVRFIGDADTRIREDALRILRFFRFYARLGAGMPDAAGLDACRRRANDLMALSRERVRDELLKLLDASDPVPAVSLMLAGGILKPVLPEIQTVERLAALVAIEQAAGDSAALRRLAALLPASPALLDDVAARLKLSTQQRKRLVAMAGHVLPLSEPAAARAAIYRMGQQAFVDCLLLNAGAAAELEPWLAMAESWQIPRLPVSGQAFIDLGLAPGPAVSGCVKAFEQAWIEDDFPCEKNRIDFLVQTILEKQVKAQLRP